MSVFSTNQVRHVYVGLSLLEGTTGTAGAIKAAKDADGNAYLQYMSPAGLVRSDLVDLKNFRGFTYKTAEELKRPLKKKKCVLSDEVNGGMPVAGQDYILRIEFRQFIGMSDEDVYYKHGVVRAFAGMSASAFYKKMAQSLVMNFSRELNQLIKFSLLTAGAAVPVNKSTDFSKLNGTYTGIEIEECDTEWIRGTMQKVPVYFTVSASPIMDNGDERNWLEVTDEAPENFVTNGWDVADLEWFSMGERGDVYRGVSYPNIINTQYLVDPTHTFDVLTLRYYFEDEGVGAQKSEKTIQVAIDTAGDLEEIKNSIASAFGITL